MRTGVESNAQNPPIYERLTTLIYFQASIVTGTGTRMKQLRPLAGTDMGRRLRLAVYMATPIAFLFAGLDANAQSLVVFDELRGTGSRSVLLPSNGNNTFSEPLPPIEGTSESRRDRTGGPSQEGFQGTLSGRLRDGNFPAVPRSSPLSQEAAQQASIGRANPAPSQNVSPGPNGAVSARPETATNDNGSRRASRSNIAISPVQTGSINAQSDDPFAPLGMRIGSWRAFSSLEQQIGYSSNADQVAMGEPGAFSQTDLSTSLQSDWSSHSARIDVNLGYREYFGIDLEAIPNASVDGELNLDLADGYALRLGAGYAYTTESATSDQVPSAAIDRSGVHSTSAFAALERDETAIKLSLRGSIERTDYSELELANGDVFSQGDRNNTLFSVTGRAGYEISPALTPFLEGEIGRRIYDLEIDRNGDRRDSTLYGVRAGLDIDLGEKLSGEVALGYQAEVFDGDLETLAGLTVSGGLIWSPVRETTVNFSAETGIAGSTAADNSGDLITSFEIEATRRLTNRLSVNANAGVELVREDGGSVSEIEWSIGTGFQYWLNRNMALTGSLNHVTQDAELGVDAFNETSVLGGIRLQH